MNNFKKRKKILIAQNPLSRSIPSRHSLPKGERKKVLIALSGGIDSAVSAYLLIKNGFQVEAAFMKNWSSTKGLVKNECPWLIDRQDALRVAAFLNIKLHTLDFEKAYAKKVMKYFFSEYKAGRTPNPDVMCNKEIKFGLLYNWARKNNFDFLATGHYAVVSRFIGSKNCTNPKISQIKTADKSANYKLLRSVDEFKDQTYFIYNIKPEQLPHILFPIGSMKKIEVRNLARKIGLPNAEKKESMGLCFVGKIRLKDFLEQKLKEKTGPIILEPSPLTSLPKGEGDKILGQHMGLHNYTIGQRQGIKVGGSGPYYVVKKDLAHNILYVTNNPKDPQLMVKELQLHSVNWIDPQGLRAKGVALSIKNLALSASRYTLLGRYRHQGELVPLKIHQIKKDLYRVDFKSPQKAIASGQSLVLYKGKQCVGGGVIA